MNRSCIVFFLFGTLALLTACSGTRSASPLPAAPAGVASHRGSPGTSQYELLYAFKGTPDGASPLASLVSVRGKLYGTTLNGSSNYCSQSCGSNHCYLGCGTVFSIDKSGSERVVYNFKGTFNSGEDGAWPFAGLTVLGGLLYGTTGGGGANAEGTVFSVSKSGKETVLHSFSGGSDGEDPEATLIDVKGTLYGTTVYGGGTGCGGNGCGTVFSITSGGKEKVVHAFAGGSDGARVYAPLTYLHGKLYGATLQGGGTGCGGDGCGAIFELSLSGKEHVIYSFGAGTNGAFPNGLTAVGGLLYGTTEGGGTKSSGTFFSITQSGSEKLLYSFQDIPDGNGPGATLLYLKGGFYGTTVGGGTTGDGALFEVGKTGSESVLYSFQGGGDGADPQAAVIAVKDTLYSTTYKGGGSGCYGSNGCGTVFAFTL